MIDELRRVSFCRQFSLLYWRNMVSAVRNPLQLLAIVVLAFIQSVMLISLYNGAGELDKEDFIGLEKVE